MKTRNWQPNELADASGVTLTQIMHVLKGIRNPGDKTLRGLSEALELPQAFVFRKAGMITDDEPIKGRRVEDDDGEISLEELAADQEELLAIYDQLDEDDRETLLALAKNMRERDRAKQNDERRPKAPAVRQGSAKTTR